MLNKTDSRSRTCLLCYGLSEFHAYDDLNMIAINGTSVGWLKLL